MKTLYIDVYFLINFTVDVLAIFISSRIIHTKLTIKKIIISGILGAFLAIIELFIKNVLLHVIIAALFIFIISVICCRDVSISRCIKFIVSFYIAAFLISGAVNFIYGILDKYLSEILSLPSASTNRKALIFSLIILIIIGALRLFIMMLSDTINEKSTRILIKIDDKDKNVNEVEPSSRVHIIDLLYQ